MKSRDRIFLLIALGVILATALTEWALGRLPFGPDGKFGLWEADIWSSGCSQRMADAYAFSHIIHGMLFYALLWLVARRLPISARYLMAVLLEAGWELLENSPLIINRYRDATMALGYVGDSILNSTSDILMMSFGFFLAWKLRPPVTVTLILAMEIGCLFWIRDNLTLNVIMLVHPVEAIKRWQLEGRKASQTAPAAFLRETDHARTLSRSGGFPPHPRERIFAFFSNAANLGELTPKSLGFEILPPIPSPLAEGAVIDYRIHLRGWPMRWRSRIRDWKSPEEFSDEQLRGPYRLWVHRHIFENVEGGTLVRDRVRYALPFPPFGELALPLVRAELNRIFAFRREAMIRLFGTPS